MPYRLAFKVALLRSVLLPRQRLGRNSRLACSKQPAHASPTAPALAHRRLGGYEMHDLVVLDNATVGVVVNVEADALRVLTNQVGEKHFMRRPRPAMGRGCL